MSVTRSGSIVDCRRFPLWSLAVICCSVVCLSCSSAEAQTAPQFTSSLLTPSTEGHVVPVSVDISGVKSLFLVVTDGGDGFGCDWADWIEPKLVGPEGELKLTELKWKSAVSGFGKPTINGNCEGRPMLVNGKEVAFGIGTHANSVIEYMLPEGATYNKFTATGGLDDQGTKQGCGSTVKFLVFTDKPDAKYLVAAASAPVGGGSRDPLDAVAGLDVAPGLEANLFASEASGMLNPTDIDIDHLGRVWVCEVVNYRHRKGERPAGDRILIVEDTNGDGVSDRQSVFYQGTDIDTALGICVLPTPSGKGTKVIVSVAPNVIQFTDVDGDSKFDPAVDKKEFLFTKVGQPQHDHSTHAFVFGPDGKYYWNVGNTGIAVHDKDGNIVTDITGREVRDNGKPYFGGMVFRCNPDGSEFEVLAHNFRNNYEVAVDSFGALWQSDNDDDGNRGVRINFVMEFGNYGYRDEVTGAGWNTPRTNLEKEIPLRHWHQNDPGVVPNLLQTGAGSPTGICVYEGTLLPEIFQNQVIHCDAGPNVVRAYPVKKSGAGYTAEAVNILQGARDNWFRPSDVCVAPDGSLIVADWYDPGVGGHRMGDAEKGRLFRVAPPKSPYAFPKVDVSTMEGAIAALKSPNLATRYVAFNALREMGDNIEAPLLKLATAQKNQLKDPEARLRARAMWLLTKLKDKGIIYASQFLTDKNPGVRIAALHAARQLINSGVTPATVESAVGEQRTTVSYEESIIRSNLNQVLTTADVDLAVLREVAVALRHSKSSSKPLFWAELATRHNGTDRWYLEALGIGAGDDWDACLQAWLKLSTNPSTTADTWKDPARRDIVWRSRAKQTPALLVSILSSEHVSAEEAPRYLRAFDFLKGQEKEDALIQLAFGNFSDEVKTKYINTEAISRLKGFNVAQNAQHQEALNRVLSGLVGQPQFVSLVDKFSAVDRYGDLAHLAATKPDDQIGIDAIRVLLSKNQLDLIETELKSSREEGRVALGIATALSNSGDGRVVGMLLPLVKDPNTAADLRRQSIRGATLTKAGAEDVLKLAEAKSFDETFTPALAASLQSAPLDAAQKEIVTKLFPAPEGKNSKPIPPLSELATAKGNAANGSKLFASSAKCSSCHIVNDQGKEVGPNLSEIGSKLSRQAMFESIIYPSAGISHNYETYTAAMNDGTVFNGILVSQTDESVVLRNNEAISRTIAKKDIDELVKQKLSLMPADLAKLLSLEELTDVVEYLTTLKKKS